LYCWKACTLVAVEKHWFVPLSGTYPWPFLEGIKHQQWFLVLATVSIGSNEKKCLHMVIGKGVKEA
jgi:hypothetical protein